MKTVLTAIVLLALCTAATCQPVAVGSGSDRFQSVSGDFGRAWINNFLAQNPEPAEDKNLTRGLWGWGGKPKGKAIVGGKLVDEVNNTDAFDFSANWLGDTTYLGNPIYLNRTSGIGNYANVFGGSPLSPLFLSDDPWVLAQQLERPVIDQFRP